MRPFAGLLLMGLTLVTATVLALAIGNYYHFTVIDPPKLRSGDPNIGFGLLILALLINVPTVLLWCAVFAFGGSQKPNDQAVNDP
jgi:hypothetical protein